MTASVDGAAVTAIRALYLELGNELVQRSETASVEELSSLTYRFEHVIALIKTGRGNPAEIARFVARFGGFGRLPGGLVAINRVEAAQDQADEQTAGFSKAEKASRKALSAAAARTRRR